MFKNKEKKNEKRCKNDLIFGLFSFKNRVKQYNCLANRVKTEERCMA